MQVRLSNYLKENDIQVDRVMAEKPPAIGYIDDRAIRFTGDTTELLKTIKEFEPWYIK